MDSSKGGRSKKGRSCNFPTSILDLPFCIVVEIFLRLPITTLVGCRCVCKSWFSYISNPEFGKIYLKKPPFVSVVLLNVDTAYSLLELKADYDYTLSPNSPKVFRNPDVFSKGLATLLGSCNGLLCFLHHSWEYGYKLSICNPVTGECALLPQPSKDKRAKTDAFLFGFSEKTNEYKVLRILTRKYERGKTEAQVCTFGIDNSWRILNQDAPLPHGRKWLDPSFFDEHQICEVTFNGAIHWITKDLVRPDFLFSFDVGEEKVRPVPPPRGLELRNGYTALGVLRDCLCIFQISDSQLDIWSMKEYGVLNSWTKEIIKGSCLPYNLRYYPIVSWRGKEMLLCTDYGTLISYNPKEERSTKVTINVNRVRSYAVPHLPCFLSLKDIVKGFGGQLKFLNEKKTCRCD